MKEFAKFSLIAVLLSVVYGCASDGIAPKPMPPEAMNPVFLHYKELPEEKVFVLAIDPTGEWAFGYEHSQKSLEEAAKKAAIKCDREREKFKVFAKPTIFAINNDVIYYDTK